MTVLEPGQTVEKYVVEATLGQGGMAVVYCVRHRSLGTRHALKLLTVASPDLQERLVNEGRVQASLDHPNIVGVTDVIEYNGMPGLVMEYVEGPPLDEWLHHHRPSLREALAVFRGIVLGVGAAHAKGMVHRDLKPANVLLDLTSRGAVPRVMDFGLVKVDGDHRRTRSGSTMGTPAFMAPEQIRDATKVDRRADLYSLGVILYQLITGQVPYPQTDLIELFQAVVEGRRPEPRSLVPDLPIAIDDCIEALMEVDPKDRLPDCASVLIAVDGPKAEASTVITARGHAGFGPPKPMPDEVSEAILPSDSAGYLAASSLVREISPVETLAPRSSQPTFQPDVAEHVGSSAPSTLAPTPAPATQRSSSTPAPRGSRLPWLLVGVLSVLLLGVIGASTTGLLVATLWPGQAPPPLPAPPTVQVPSSPSTDDDLPEPSPSVASTTAEPAMPSPVSTPTVPASAPTIPAYRPSTPSPEPDGPPTPPAAEPEAPEPTGPQPGRFVVVDLDAEGTQIDVILVKGSDAYQAERPVPPGTYDVIARFGGGKPIEHGRPLKVEEGRTATIRCSSKQMRCKYP